MPAWFCEVFALIDACPHADAHLQHGSVPHSDDPDHCHASPSDCPTLAAVLSFRDGVRWREPLTRNFARTLAMTLAHGAFCVEPQRAIFRGPLAHRIPHVPSSRAMRWCADAAIYIGLQRNDGPDGAHSARGDRQSVPWGRGRRPRGAREATWCSKSRTTARRSTLSGAESRRCTTCIVLGRSYNADRSERHARGVFCGLLSSWDA
ncbi:hypothetical protein HYPSUDRAFT_867029 [Hypholoma sublateritium FD-334 SS-4]|uniref:Uncharacterized protein n=1 Tax=Hypholoma sublateritium (strain FD-334 SS-4) TaxID=945553 RepID=A0A0D2MUI4_HYPSF|nr:hypothetical protein HYPSUDRAFT_867029 [Hypholoma sublateritium FD-334 SS-4]